MKKCKNCWKPRNHNNPLLSLCKECYYTKELENKKQLKFPKKTYKRKNTWEKDLFLQIWNERQHICNKCGKNLPKMRTWNFSHIKSKWSRPDLRLDPNNIELLCFACHFEYDHWLKYKGPELDI